MLKSSKALQFLFLVGLSTTIIGIPALLLFVVALKWIFLIYPAVFIGLVLLISYIAAICMLYDDIFGKGWPEMGLDKNTVVKAKTIYLAYSKEFNKVHDLLKWSSADLTHIYCRFEPLIEALGIERYLDVFYPESLGAEIAMVFTELINILPYNSYNLKPVELYRKWVNNKLLIVQVDEDDNIIYNYDIDNFLVEKNMDEECEIYIIDHEGKFGDYVTDTRAAIAVEYKLTEVKRNDDR
ncbi:MAG: hypothetical protein HXM02_05770 [[Eubacterium] sulci]|nr:hypothetical protein [[Eubacterium] sulci]